MTKKPGVTTIATGYYSRSALNTNFEALNDAFDNTLSLDGSTPNSMQGNLDLNGNEIINGVGKFNNLYLNNALVSNLSTAFNFRSAWVGSTSYNLYDVVAESGNSYIALESHTSGPTFSVDLSGGKWFILAAKGASGSGSGDMLASNNLSDLASSSTAIGNLGITATAAELNYVEGVTSNVQTQLDARSAQAASSWETGTSTTEGIVSPAKVKSAVESLLNLNSASANSYIVLNGLYVQWLSASINLDEDTTTTVTFPVEFPNAVFNVFTTTEKDSGTSMDAFDIYVRTKSTTSAVLKVASNSGSNYGTGTVHVLAIGN